MAQVQRFLCGEVLSRHLFLAKPYSDLSWLDEAVPRAQGCSVLVLAAGTETTVPCGWQVFLL